MIDEAGAGRVGREHPAKLVREHGVRLREIGQQSGSLLRRFRKKSLEHGAKLAEFFSRHTQALVMITRAGAHGSLVETEDLFLSGQHGSVEQ